ncbi:expressed protein [Phakopsora pachyrhizi]|uniref:ATP-dependent DNA helicase n=1 Tax=Phakopsora pachyrhizi TaxID=170000 RepID=A0AAV0BKT6_PHAPC|nr:expressed protein [Phakopsora pachyrhizi]
MLNPELFEKISILCQAIRRIPRPFGGIQLILSGDFFQLPPVLKEHDFSCMYCGCPRFKRIEESNGGKCERDYESSEGSDSEERKRKRKRVLIKCVKPFNHDWREVPCGRERLEYIFCFETPTWRQSNLIVIQLKKIFRQEEKSLIEVLNKVNLTIIIITILSHKMYNYVM